MKRNIERFPDDFMLRLTSEEWENLKCQIGISNASASSSGNSSQTVMSGSKNKALKSQIVISSEHGGRRAIPYAFTEQGVAMLSSVLRSQ